MIEKAKRGGLLIYKCRRCGQETDTDHVPDLVMALVSICMNDKTPKEWGVALHSMSVHWCSDGSLGVSDLQGGTFDPREIHW